MKEFKLENLVRPNILQLKPYSSARDEYHGKTGVFLDANENPYGKWNRYPDPHQLALKQKLSEIKNVPTNQIFLGNGSDEVIDLVFRIFCRPGVDKALLFPPTYGMYGVSANINDIETMEVPLTPDFQIDWKKVKPLLQDPNLKVIFVCSPNNPTGNTLKNLHFILDNFGGLIFVDEAYIDFCPEKSLVPQLKKYPNLLISQTFSKARGLAAARVGIAYSSPEIIELMNRTKPPYNISQLNQEAALEALNDREKFEHDSTEILKEKKRLKENLLQLPIVQKIYPSDANFLLVEVPDANKTYEALIAEKVIVRNRNSVVRDCLRITIGTKEENDQLLNALKKMKA